MSVAAASFLTNSWDIPIRRTGYSFLMSGDGPHQLYSSQQHQQQQENQQEQEQELAHDSFTNDQGAFGHEEDRSPRACFSPLSLAGSSSGSLHSTPGIRSHQNALLSPGSFRQQPIPEQAGLWQFQQQHEQQQQDSTILQKFSALSVRISQSAAAHSGAPPAQARASCGVRSEPVSPGNCVHVHSQRALTQAQHGLMRSRSNNTAGFGGCSSVVSASSSLSGASTPSGVFASLDAVDEHSPPSSPAETAMPALFTIERASSFPAYAGRNFASTNTLCCCSGGVTCNTCKGVPFPQPLRASVSHPVPSRQLSQPAGLHSHAPRRGDVSSTSPPGDSWFFYSQALHAPPSGAAAMLSQGGDAMSHLGWDILQQQAPHHSVVGGLSPGQGHAMLNGYPSGSSRGGVSPSPSGFLESRHGGVGAGRSAGAERERDLADQWGFGLQSMDSSSLSLSQDCSDSVGEINSGAANEQEADSSPARPALSYAQGSLSPIHHKQSALLPPTPPGPGRSGGMGSSLAPCPVSNPMLTRPAPGSSPASPSMRRGLSSYFGGKSRSFTSLSDVSSIQSIQELAKPVRNFARRKRIASNNKDGSPCSGIEATRRVVLGVGKDAKGGGSLFKKGTGSRQSLGFQAGLAVAVAMGDVDVSSGRDMLAGFILGSEEEDEGMETVMEEAEGGDEGVQSQQQQQLQR